MTRITVVGSINLDFVASADKLPAPGETVTGAAHAPPPPGNGAHHPRAPAPPGATGVVVGQVGADAMADEALALLDAEGVDLSMVAVDSGAATGVALIAVAKDGENQIVVAPGANAAFAPGRLTVGAEGPRISPF